MHPTETLEEHETIDNTMNEDMSSIMQTPKHGHQPVTVTLENNVEHSLFAITKINHFPKEIL